MSFDRLLMMIYMYPTDTDKTKLNQQLIVKAHEIQNFTEAC